MKKLMKGKKFKTKSVVKPSRVTLVLKHKEPEPYVSRYFKDAMKEAKKAMFFK